MTFASNFYVSPATFRCPRAVFVFIGSTPHTAWLPDEIKVDDDGFISTGVQAAASGVRPLHRSPFLLETSHPGILPREMPGSAPPSAWPRRWAMDQGSAVRA